MKYELGDIFELDDEYSARAEFCNANNFVIKEIEMDDYGNRKFQICEAYKPTEEDLIEQEIYELKENLVKFKEDVEQVELFGMERNDYEEKKKVCAEIILRLRELEKRLADI